MTNGYREGAINASIIQTKDWDLDLGVNFTKLTIALAVGGMFDWALVPG